MHVTGPHALSAMELTILALVAKGYSSKEIAVEVGRAKPTIECYVRLMLIKLDARSRAHLVSTAYQRGILDLCDR